MNYMNTLYMVGEITVVIFLKISVEANMLKPVFSSCSLFGLRALIAHSNISAETCLPVLLLHDSTVFLV